MNTLVPSISQAKITVLLGDLDKQANALLANLKESRLALDGPTPEASEPLPPPQEGAIALAQDIKRVLDMCINLSIHIRGEL